MQYQRPTWPHSLTVRTPGFHPGNRSSILLGVTMKQDQLWLVFFHGGFSKRNRTPSGSSLIPRALAQNGRIIPVFSLAEFEEKARSIFSEQTQAQQLCYEVILIQRIICRSSVLICVWWFLAIVFLAAWVCLCYAWNSS